MMIKVNGEYLDFDGDIEIESQIKLFDEIETSNGDYSYSFEIPITSKNLKLLGFPYPDTIKSIYRNVSCDIVDDSGFITYSGSLQVGSISDFISCTFFSGNTEWFGLLSQPMSALALYKYDINLTRNNIEGTWSNDSGIVFPIIDTGALITRGAANVMVEDFTSCFYIKTLFKEIFNAQGIKLEGDLLNDDLYNMLTVASNAKSQDDIDNRSMYANKTSDQTITSSISKVLFQDDSTFPFFDGSNNNYVSSTYTADVKMQVTIDINLKMSLTPTSPVFTIAVIHIYKNGASFKDYVYFAQSGPDQFNKSVDLQLNAGDTIEIYADSIGTGDNYTINQDSTLKITPFFIYKVFGKSSVPNWTQGEFVSNVLRIFNVLPSYNVANKTLTLNLFKNIKTKEAIDISNDITITNTDFTEFISDYGKSNEFKYQEGSDEDLKQYNISNFISYGAGTLEIDNDFVENSADVLESDFTSPITYLNGVFDMSMERINFVELEEVKTKDITSVTDSSGTPRFNVNNADSHFSAGDLVRIENDDVDSYNGDWIVTSSTSTYFTVRGADYDADTTGTATLLQHKFTTDDNVYLFVNIPNKSTLFFSRLSSMYLGLSSFSNTSLAYFNMLNNGRQVNTKYKQSLSFGEVNNPLSYQQTMLQTYWGPFWSILKDPVMLTASCYFDRNKFTDIKTFLNPVRIKTNMTNNLYYLNRITGYKNGHEPCEAELIKL